METGPKVDGFRSVKHISGRNINGAERFVDKSFCIYKVGDEQLVGLGHHTQPSTCNALLHSTSYKDIFVFNHSAHLIPTQKFILEPIHYDVYGHSYYVPFSGIATLSPEIAKFASTIGPEGKNFCVARRRVHWLIGPLRLIKYVAVTHTKICYSSVSPLREVVAASFEQTEGYNFWCKSTKKTKGMVDRCNEVFGELGLPPFCS